MRGIRQAREDRGKGVPLSDIERVMRHYNIDRATAEYWLTIHPLDELLPERGYGLTGIIRQGAYSFIPPIIIFGSLASLCIGAIIKKLGR